MGSHVRPIGLRLGSRFINEVSTGSSLPQWPTEDSRDIPMNALLDVAIAAETCAQGIEFTIRVRHPPVGVLEKVHELVGPHAAGPEELKGTALYAHDELTFGSSSLSDDLIACQ